MRGYKAAPAVIGGAAAVWCGVISAAAKAIAAAAEELHFA